MIKYFLNISILVLSISFCCCESDKNINVSNKEHQPTIDDSEIEKKMLEQLSIYSDGFMYGNNFEEGYKLLYPSVKIHFLQNHPEASEIDFKNAFKKMTIFFAKARDKGLEIKIEKPKILKKIIFDRIIIYKLNLESQMTFQGKTQHNSEKNLAISFDNGSNWYFLQISDETKDILKLDSRITDKIIDEVL